MEYTIVGKIINTHGIKGQMKIYPLTDNVERFKKLETAYLGQEKLKVSIDKVDFFKNLVILKFKEFDNINEVLKFKDSDLFIDDKDRVVLPENHFFIYDLLGIDVYDMEDKFIGTIKDVIQGPSNDIYLIKSIDDKEFLIPAVKEFIKLVDIERKKMSIDPIEGMIQWKLIYWLYFRRPSNF